MRRGLGATYRLQLRPGFGFREAAAVTGYLADLGIEVVYLSPITESPPGSTHGYDVSDPTELRNALGGAAGFGALVRQLERRGLGLLLDIVPNHLSTWTEGPWWGDVLRNGRDSQFGDVFDIDWDAGPPDAQGKVALPILDRPLAEVIAAGRLTVEVTASGSSLRYGDVLLPTAEPVGHDDNPAKVLAAQHYRLVPWRDRTARNYRRFFDIDGLVGARVEDPDVFERTHCLFADLADQGLISGVRVDHVDGLADPTAYLGQLAELLGGIPVIVEKILTADERLPAAWAVAGTTGYEAIDDIGGALVDPAGLERLVAGAMRAGDRAVGIEVRSGKQTALDGPFRADLDRVTRLLDVDRADLRHALVELPAYRSYLGSATAPAIAPDDAGLAAFRDCASPAVLKALTDLPARLEGVLRLQQLSPAVTAKGVEDTAWYRLAGPLAFCEVGGDPARSRSRGERRLVERAAAAVAAGHGGLVPGTTHDTKRSADARARLLALAEMPDEFEAGLVRLGAFLPPSSIGDGTEVPTPLEMRFLAESLLAVLPPAARGWADLDRRMAEAFRKSAREAKVRTSWAEPDLEYEDALVGAVSSALANRAALLRKAFGGLVDEVARLGAVIALSQVVLRSVLPGFPDCYQGDETWNLSLVDPDNRRPVDFESLEAELGSLTTTNTGDEPAFLRSSWRDGRVKMLVTRQALRARRAAVEAFAPGAAIGTLEVTGSRAGRAVVVVRSGDVTAAEGPGTAIAVAVVTRLPRSLEAERDDLPAGPTAWRDTALVLPPEVPSRLVDAMTGRRHVAEGALAGPGPGGSGPGAGGRPGGEGDHAGARLLPLAEVLRDLPVAILLGRRQG